MGNPKTTITTQDFLKSLFLLKKILKNLRNKVMNLIEINSPWRRHAV